MKYFDTHAHYYDGRFDSELEGGAIPLLDKLFMGDVGYIINVGTSPDTCLEAIAQAKRYANMYTLLGIHPSDCQSLTVSLDEALSDIEALIKNPESKCVGIGEIGLDYHYPDTDKEKQAAYFNAQMELAKRLSLPVCIHDRDAHADVFEMIKKHPDVRGVL
ncbi:MAG: TatD family hydrolase, partial [Clostridia bacterium]|nr:TatD family hydrolase [Clostridia bacterium]